LSGRENRRESRTISEGQMKQRGSGRYVRNMKNSKKGEEFRGTTSRETTSMRFKIEGETKGNALYYTRGTISGGRGQRPPERER